MLKKLLLVFIALIALFWLMLRWGDLSGVVRALESILQPVVHKETINLYCGEYKEDPLLVMSVIKVESNFLRGAKSRRGALGFMQIMPATAKEISRELRIQKFQEPDLENPDINLRFGIYYISKLRHEFGDDDRTVLAAYNAGKKNVQEWLKLSGKKALDLEDIQYIETRNFVEDVLWNYRWLKQIQKFRGRIIKKTEIKK